jgi:beta-N-acetylhexosaminidase
MLTGLARNDMGFKGVILTDALHMQGVIDYSGSQQEAVLMALKAGADMVMIHTDLERSYNRVLDAVKNGEISVSRIDQSVKRILELKLRRGIVRWQGQVLAPGGEFNSGLEERMSRAAAVAGSPENRAAGFKLAERAVTLLKNDRVLPFNPSSGSHIVFFAPSDQTLVSMKSAIQWALGVRGVPNVAVKGFIYRDLKELTAEQKYALDRAHFVIHATCSYSDQERDLLTGRTALFSVDLVNYAVAENKPLAVMAVGDPYDIAFMPGIKAYLALYGVPTGPSVTAGVNTIFGLNRPAGRLPVPIPAAGGGGLLFPEGYGLGYAQ